MKNIDSLPVLSCTFMQLSYAEWIAIDEPLIFHICEIKNPVYNLPSSELINYTSWVTLLQVGTLLYKLDGQQRKDLWLSGKQEPPDNLTARVITLNKQDFEALDTQSQTLYMDLLPSYEVIKKIYVNLDLNFKSERLKGGLIFEALNIALRGVQRGLQDRRVKREKVDLNLTKAISLFREELLFLDTLNPKQEIYVTGVLAGVLIMLGTDRPLHVMHDFLIRLNEKQTEFRNNAEDPIACLLRTINGYSYRITQKVMQQRMSIDLCKKTVQAMLLYVEGRDSPKYWRKKDLSGVDHMPYVRELKQHKNITHAMDL